MWDGRLYAECVIDASQRLGGFRCAEHLSHSYVALLAAAQWFAPASVIPVLLTNAVLLGLSAFALYRICLQVFPAAEHALGRALVVAAFLVHPIVLASVVQPGLDFGILVFTLCALAAMLEERRWLVVLFGVLLVFAKEPGVLLYGIIAALYLWRHVLQRHVPTLPYWLGVIGAAEALALNLANGGLRSATVFAVILAMLLLRRPEAPREWRAAAQGLPGHWMLALPLVAVFGYMAYAAVVRSHLSVVAGAPGAPVLWSNTGSSTLVATVFRPGVLDVSTLSVLAMMLVVGFVWVPTVIMTADLATAALRRRLNAPPRALPGVDVRSLGAVTGALLGSIWFLSRYPTFTNARYYLPVYPLALVVTYSSLVRLSVSRPMRHLTFGVVGVLLALSITRTVDPVSRALWGTFAVGERSMLVSTSLSGECCGAGRDQLVYNLEFTQFDALTSKALAVMHPTRATVVVVAPLGDWYTVGPVDTASARRTLARTGVVTPQTITAPVAFQSADQLSEAWYLGLPYLDNSQPLATLAERFEVAPPTSVEHDGYAMDIWKLRARRTR